MDQGFGGRGLRFGLRAQCARFRAWGLGFRGLGFRVWVQGPKP